MGLIRSGNTALTPLSADTELTAYLWPIVCEMIKTAVENKQNLIVEGCYIPPDWKNSFEAEYLEHIKFLCLVMSENYIENNFEKIKAYGSVIEKRLDDSDFTREICLEENRKMLNCARENGWNYVVTDREYNADVLLAEFE